MVFTCLGELILKLSYMDKSMSYRTRTESIGPKLRYSRSDLADDVVNSVCN